MRKVTIPNKFNMDSTLVITPSDGGYSTPEVHVHVTGEGLPMLNVRRTDFIAGLEEALDGTFIEHSTLPEVEFIEGFVPGSFQVGQNYFGPQFSAEFARQQIMNNLVALRHIESRPVVDQEQVEAFNQALIEAEMDHADGPVPFKVAQDLVRLGYKITKEI